MTLYYEAARFLETSNDNVAIAQGSLKSRVFGTKDLKSKPTQVYALVIEATKWSQALAPIIEATGLLEEEKKLTPCLALLTVHDLLLSKGGIAAPKEHVLRKSVERHQARLSSNFTRARLKAGCGSLEAWKAKLLAVDPLSSEDAVPTDDSRFIHPRWVRINTLKTSLDHELRDGIFKGWKQLQSIKNLNSARSMPNDNALGFAVDDHVPNLIATPPGTDLTGTSAYKEGRIILQDKASCFPALLLNPGTSSGSDDILDACAAPGNKTTHLAALCDEARANNSSNLTTNHRSIRGGTIFAVERDPERAKTLESMVATAGASDRVSILAKQDFLKLRADHVRFANVTSILLDPSCSGSGIVGRDEGEPETTYKLVLPRHSVPHSQAASSKQGRKRKRSGQNGSTSQPVSTQAAISNGDRFISSGSKDPSAEEQSVEVLQARLKRLSSFQITMLKHAMSFPRCSHIVYSTCSIHPEEDEHVVLEALQSQAGAEHGEWRPLRRDSQPVGLRNWPKRGRPVAFLGKAKEMEADMSKVRADELAEACLRCDKGTSEGTMGFFVCAFERTISGDGRGSSNGVEREMSRQAAGDNRQVDSDDEWEGFGDD
ncbi:MAG: hypothetical protein Q9162_004091 [Coniocarpon cinnabarinum]